MKLKINHKFRIIILINVISLLMIGLVGFISIRKMNHAKEMLVGNSKLLVALLPAQNYRDNIRSVIYRSSCLDISNAEEKAELEKEFNTQITGLHKGLSNLEGVRLSHRFDSLKNDMIDKSKTFKIAALSLFERQLVGDFEAYALIGNFITLYDEVLHCMTTLTNELEAANIALEKQGADTAETSANLIVVLVIVSLAASLAVNLGISSNIVKRLRKSEAIFSAVSKGILPEKEKNTGSDEIGQMLTSLNSYIDSLNRTSKFAEEIGKGNFDHPFEPLSHEDKLGNSLLHMRDNLKQNTEEEHRRNWATEGLAQFSTLLRQQTAHVDDFYADITKFVVKYTRSNQGCLFLLNNHEDGSPYLQLAACYAWSKRKYTERKIEEGEGLVGQCLAERHTIYMTNIPKNYIHITSGLGQALPRALLIVPLKVNDELCGVIEIASFEHYQKHEIAVVEKLAENMASAVLTTRTNERTKQLLEQSQQQAEQMRDREETMRQNVEELCAIQEEMARKEKDYMAKIESLEKFANVSERPR